MNIIDIQKKIKECALDAYIVSYGNRFIGQDVLSDEHKLKYLSGFSGSAGALVITSDDVYLLVDGRYELQAQKEVDSDKITIIKQTPRLKNVCDLLNEKGLLIVGYDAWCYSVSEIEYVKRKYKNICFRDEGDWVEKEVSQNVEVLRRSIEFSGESSEDKCRKIANFLWEQQADYYLFSSADSVSWLMNIYAKDLLCSPVVRAYAVVSLKGEVTLFADNLISDLNVKKWHEFIKFFEDRNGAKVLYDGHSTPEKIKNLLKDIVVLEKSQDICQTIKVRKNLVELEGMKNAHIRDGVAVVKFLSWLENNWQGKTELDIVDKLYEFRSKQKYFFSNSFETIAGMGENGAIVHYQPDVNTNKMLKNNNVILIDSGAQYLDGTTDITRTIVLGKPSSEMQDDFTYVLKAHIKLMNAKFPKNTEGMKLDVLAREQLWQKGLDYKHGTGHGVACFGNVHEGPISMSTFSSTYGLDENMIMSIEPGVYKEGKYGIRIENLVYIAKDEKISNDIDFLEFKYLTKVPIDKRLINKYLLTQGEQEWLNKYHREVFDSLVSYLDKEEIVWLEKACSPL